MSTCEGLDPAEEGLWVGMAVAAKLRFRGELKSRRATTYEGWRRNCGSLLLALLVKMPVQPLLPAQQAGSVEYRLVTGTDISIPPPGHRSTPSTELSPSFPRAAFQYGIKMSEGRKTRRFKETNDKAELDRQWKKISAVSVWCWVVAHSGCDLSAHPWVRRAST